VYIDELRIPILALGINLAFFAWWSGCGKIYDYIRERSEYKYITECLSGGYNYIRDRLSAEYKYITKCFIQVHEWFVRGVSFGTCREFKHYAKGTININCGHYALWVCRLNFSFLLRRSIPAVRPHCKLVDFWPCHNCSSTKRKKERSNFVPCYHNC